MTSDCCFTSQPTHPSASAASAHLRLHSSPASAAHLFLSLLVNYLYFASVLEYLSTPHTALHPVSPHWARSAFTRTPLPPVWYHSLYLLYSSTSRAAALVVPDRNPRHPSRPLSLAVAVAVVVPAEPDTQNHHLNYTTAAPCLGLAYTNK